MFAAWQKISIEMASEPITMILTASYAVVSQSQVLAVAAYVLEESARHRVGLTHQACQLCWVERRGLVLTLPLRPWHPFSLHHRIYWRISDFLFTIVDKQRGCAGMLREPILVAESAANDEERARLGLFPGEMVYRVDRIRGQGEQLLVENIRLPAALFPHLQNPVPSISDLADTYGIAAWGSARKSLRCPCLREHRQSSRRYARHAASHVGQSSAFARRSPSRVAPHNVQLGPGKSGQIDSEAVNLASTFGRAPHQIDNALKGEK